MSEHDNGQTRRDFLKIGAAAGLGAAVAGLELGAREKGIGSRGARSQFKVAPIDRPSGSASSASAAWARPTSRTTSTSTASRSRPSATSSRTRSSGPRSGSSTAGQPKPAGYSNGPARFQADVRDRGPRPGHDRDALGVARPGLRRGHEERQARRDRGPGGHVASTTAGQLVETAEKTGKHCQMMENCCYDRIELMTLNLVRQGRAGRGPPRRGGLSPRPARGQVLQGGRGAVAAGLGPEAQRQPLSDPRPRPGRPVHEHQPRRRLRFPRLDEQPDARPARIRGREVRPRFAAGRRRNTSWATSTPASSGRSSARRSSSSTTPTCPGPTPGSTSSRGPRASPTSGPTGSTSRARRPSPTSGTTSRSSPPSSSIRCGRPSPRRARAAATAAWITSRTTG